MKIVFYSTNSNLYNCEDFETKTIPSCASRWDLLAEEYSEHEFYILTQLPGMFMLDLQKENVVANDFWQYMTNEKMLKTRYVDAIELIDFSFNQSMLRKG